MFFVVGSSVRVLKAATFKRFSVRSCWSPILLKLQNSIVVVFRCIFNKISEHVFYRTTINWYFGTKKGVNIGHQLFCLGQELLQKRPKFRFFSFCYKFQLGITFGGVAFKECLWPRKNNTNLAFVERERKYSFFEKLRGVLQKC